MNCKRNSLREAVSLESESLPFVLRISAGLGSHSPEAERDTLSEGRQMPLLTSTF